MHMASIGLFEGEALRDTEGELRLADLRALISSRLSLVPKLRQRPQPGVLPEAPLVWTDDPHFDVANHVVQQRLGPPGTESDLLALCGQILAAPLNQNQPLWELRFVDGLENGRVAVIEKLHHSMADGIAAAELAMVLLNLSPEPEPDPVDDTSVWRATEPRPALFGATSDVLRLAEIPLRCLGWGAWTALHPFRRSRTLITKATAMASVVRGGLIAPHSLLNGGIGPERAFHVLRLSLNEVREVAHAHGTTVNDVVLTVVSQGLHRLMAKDGTLDQGAEVQALVPVSLSADPAGRDLGNRVSALFVRLPVGRDDPLSALGTVASLSKDHKKQHQELAGDAMLRLLEPAPQSVFGLLAKLLRHQPFFNVIVTNVPGPRVPLYALGAQMIEAFPVVPLVGNQSIGVAALSYLDQINLGILSDPGACPDVDLFCEGARAAFEVLRHEDSAVVPDSLPTSTPT